MTNTLVVLGDSLGDAGNTAFVFSQLGLDNPYQGPVYAGGGNVKASDDLVVAEHVALEMGGMVDDAQLISILSQDEPKDVQVHNYAHAYAATDSSPMLSEDIGIGLKEQVKSLLQRKDYYQDQSDVDVILNCGINDIYVAFSQIDQIKEVISTKSKEDDNKYVYDFVKPIAYNIKKAVYKLDGVVDDIAVAGTAPIMDLPDSQDWLTNFPSEDREQVTKLISKIGTKVTRKLQKKFENNPNVHVNNAYEVFDQLESPSFIDGFHPDSKTASQIAKLYVNEMTENLETFGF